VGKYGLPKQLKNDDGKAYTNTTCKLDKEKEIRNANQTAPKKNLVDISDPGKYWLGEISEEGPGGHPQRMYGKARQFLVDTILDFTQAVVSTAQRYGVNKEQLQMLYEITWEEETNWNLFFVKKQVVRTKKRS